MSKINESKRVSFTTLSSASSTGFAAGLPGSRFGSEFLSATTEKSTNSTDKKSSNKTIRLSLELFQTDSCSYPEFNYSKLMHVEKVSSKFMQKFMF